MSLKILADKINIWEEYIGINMDAILNKLTQELWEFNDAVQKYRWIYCRTKYENIEEVEKELGDLLFNLISICNRLGINPDRFPEILEKAWQKAEDRKEIYKAILTDRKENK